MSQVTVFDYGAGNLHSLLKVLEGSTTPDGTPLAVRVEDDPRAALRTDVLVLPGVGAWDAGASRLAPARAEVRDALRGGLPCVGICLGMQLLFESSEEAPGQGIGLLAGAVTRLRAQRVPEIGWNSVDEPRDARVREAGLSTAYYAHSFVCRPDDAGVVTAWTTHETDRFAAAVASARTVGVQFHPEKSSAPGVRFLRAVVGQAAA